MPARIAAPVCIRVTQGLVLRGTLHGLETAVKVIVHRREGGGDGGAGGPAGAPPAAAGGEAAAGGPGNDEAADDDYPDMGAGVSVGRSGPGWIGG